MVDDEKRFRDTTRKILMKKGFDTILADSIEYSPIFWNGMFSKRTGPVFCNGKSYEFITWANKLTKCIVKNDKRVIILTNTDKKLSFFHITKRSDYNENSGGL